MAFLDKIKAKATDLGLDEKAALAKEKAAAAADKNRDKIAAAADKAAQVANEKTKGQYSSQINSAKQAAVKGVDKLADQGSATDSAHVETAIAGETAATGESRVERAVGADAPSVSLDPQHGTQN